MTLPPKLDQMIDNIDRHEIFMLGASIAYTTALALAPFMVIMLSAVTFFGVETQQNLINEVTALLGRQAGDAIEVIVKSANEKANFNGISGIISFIVIAISASAIFSQLRYIFDKINDRIIPNQNFSLGLFIRQKISAVGLVLGFIFLLISSLLATTAMATAFGTRENFFWKIILSLTDFSVFTLLFAAMFRFIPTDRLAWRGCWLSGVSAALFFLVGKALIGIYIGSSAIGSAYGAAGSLAVLLVWLYYISIALLVSYEFTRAIFLDKELLELKAHELDNDQLRVGRSPLTPHLNS